MTEGNKRCFEGVSKLHHRAAQWQCENLTLCMYCMEYFTGYCKSGSIASVYLPVSSSASGKTKSNTLKEAFGLCFWMDLVWIRFSIVYGFGKKGQLAKCNRVEKKACLLFCCGISGWTCSNKTDFKYTWKDSRALEKPFPKHCWMCELGVALGSKTSSQKGSNHCSSVMEQAVHRKKRWTVLWPDKSMFLLVQGKVGKWRHGSPC